MQLSLEESYRRSFNFDAAEEVETLSGAYWRWHSALVCAHSSNFDAAGVVETGDYLTDRSE